MRRVSVFAVFLALLLSMFGGSAALAADPDLARPVPTGVDGLRLDQPIAATTSTRPSVMAASLRSATGTRQVVVRLSADSVGDVAAAGGSPSAQRRALGAVTTQQNSFINRYDENVLGRVRVALNAVILEVDAARLQALANDPAVEHIAPVIDYQLALSETVPYIFDNEDVHSSYTGAGVSVAVLDSGIDYTHEAFGDLASVLDYDDAYGANTNSPENRDQPNWSQIAAHTNIVGGYDFVGEVWPDGRLAPDPDPIGCGGKEVGSGPALCDGGHGTHVADIIGGQLGVAPGVDMYAVKVCSAVSTSCSGVALLLGMDYALDPNADGDTADHVDLINMSLGSDYGQARDDDLSAAVETATELGVLTLAASGNASDKPYITSTPAAAPSAISVAQTAVPSDVLPLLEVVTPDGLGPYPAVFQEWSAELTDALEFPLLYDDSTDGRALGCRLDAGGDTDPSQPNPFEGEDLSGMIVLVDRGVCNFSEKVANVALAGGEAAIIGLVAPGEPFAGSLGDCPSDACGDIPGFMIHQTSSDDLKSALGDGDVVVRFDPATGLPLVGTMVGSSSRGPTMLDNRIKPEIGAPGGSVSAEAGTGSETTPFGGTSGATPMVTGSAALLLEAYSDRSPAEIKSLLMNYAETEIYNAAPDAPINAPLATIQRIGAGEVRPARSLDGADYAAWDSELLSGALSFGFVDVTDDVVTLTREVTVHNYSGSEATFDIAADFRFEDDEANGAVTPSYPAQVVVPADGEATFDVSLEIDGPLLRDWTANSGGAGADPLPLDTLEYDGYLWLTTEGAAPLHLAWHVLPRLSGEATASNDTVTITGDVDGVPSGTVTLNNSGVGFAGIDGYSLIGESPSLPAGPEGSQLPTIDLRYAGIQTIPVPAGFCSGDESFVLLLAVNTWDRQTHANAPAAFEWDLDTTGDGDADYAVYNLDLNGDLSDGRNAVYVEDLEAGTASIFFFTDHGTNSGNTVLTLCGEQIGMNADDFFAPITADLYAFDTYFTGRATDQILGMEFAPLGERYFPIVGDDGFGGGDVAAGGSETLTVLDYGAAGTNPSETGVLLFTDGSRGDFRAGADQEHETIVLRVNDGLPFYDIAGNPFVDDIVWAFEHGITNGCQTSPPMFCPGESVTRGQMALFLDRSLDLPDATADYFGDDNGTIFEDAINRLAEAGITNGCATGKYCPYAVVQRDQMASFLARAFTLPATATDYFTDDEGNFHEANINALREAGITTGCTPTKYCPTNPVTRAQMTAFLHRAIGD